MAQINISPNGTHEVATQFGAVQRELIMTEKEHAMVELVRDFVRFLSSDRLTVDRIVERIGRVEHDPGIPMSIEMNPAVPGVRSAQLVRYPDSGVPYVLKLEPEMEWRPTVGDLKAVLGDFDRALTGRGMPAQLLFQRSQDGTRWKVVVIVTVEPSVGEMDSARVAKIAFRRDPLTE